MTVSHKKWMLLVIVRENVAARLSYCKFNRQRCFTFREEPISMLDDGLNYGDHMHRCSCCHFCQRPEHDHRQVRKGEGDQSPWPILAWFCSQRSNMRWTLAQGFYPSVFAQSRLGPRTMAMLLGVILLTSLSWASLARNFTRYLQQRDHAITWKSPRNCSFRFLMQPLVESWPQGWGFYAEVSALMRCQIRHRNDWLKPVSLICYYSTSQNLLYQ